MFQLRYFTSLLPLFVILTLASHLFGQQTGKVDIEQLGMSFEVPQGWVGQFMGDGFMMGSYTEAGFIYLSIHQTSTLDGLKADARQGLNDPASGISLQLQEDLTEWKGRGVGGTYKGAMGGQAVTAYMLGLLNPHGSGVLITAATTPTQYSIRYPALVEKIAQSFRFKAIPATSQAQSSGQATGSPQEWSTLLGGTRLTYMNSYTSMDYSNPNITTGGGYREKEVIDLCKAGYFNYSSASFTSITGGANVSGNHIGKGSGAGTWEVEKNSQGQLLLILSFHSGERFEYALSYPEKKMHLNGKRYFHTWTGENAPVCY